MIKWDDMYRYARVCNALILGRAGILLAGPPNASSCTSLPVASWMLQLTSKETISVPYGLICFPVLFQDQSAQCASRFLLT